MNRATLMAVAALAAVSSSAQHVIQATGNAVRQAIAPQHRSTSDPDRIDYRRRKPWGGSVKRHARAMAKKRRR